VQCLSSCIGFQRRLALAIYPVAMGLRYHCGIDKPEFPGAEIDSAQLDKTAWRNLKGLFFSSK
jgi:hypothetical protein